jgi:hypothetical protein
VRVLDEYVREKMPAVIAAGKTYKEPEHAELVTSRIQQIALAYDELMERVAGEGMEVLRYVRP